MNISGGEEANNTGNSLERFVIDKLQSAGYTRVKHLEFKNNVRKDKAIFTTHFPACKGIYDNIILSDFIIYHPTKWPNCLIIEVKWQQVPGSVDEKYPYLVANIQQCFPYKTIVLLDGGGYKLSAEKWLRNQAGSGNLLHVFNMVEFQIWANKRNI